MIEESMKFSESGHLKTIYESLTLELPEQTREQEAIIKESKESKKGSITVTSILPTIEAIHVGMTKNFHRYSEAGLRGANGSGTGTISWLMPYPKPILKNHDMFSEPLGRVAKAYFKPADENSTGASVVVPRITDSDTIEKIFDDRYMTVSVGVDTDSAVCSVCGVDWVVEGRCQHLKGKWYNKESDEIVPEGTKGALQCIIDIGSVTFRELSFVNEPADSDAGVKNKNTDIVVECVCQNEQNNSCEITQMPYSELIGKLQTIKESVEDMLQGEQETPSNKDAADADIVSVVANQEEEDVSQEDEQIDTTISEEDYSNILAQFEEYFTDCEGIEDLYLVALEVN